MTWTYSALLPTVKDQVRLLLGDTDSADPQLQDEEIVFFTGNEPSAQYAAASAAEAIAARYARKADYTLGKDIQQKLSQLQEHYLSLGRALRRKAARQSIQPFAGGLSLSDKQSLLSDSDLVQAPFRIDADSEPGTENDETGLELYPPIP